ncbi:MAG: UDP-N-acetylmuramate dehydrogenase [Succinivibrio sp.]|nr:UDP-N-acetylmuramate dehydrogenase [Succinivibrio sp.]
MFDLTAYNTFGLHVYSKDGLIVRCVEDLSKIRDDKFIILGKGSDVLLTDDYDGTVLIDEIKDLEISEEQDSFLVKAGGGIVLDDLIAKLVSQNIGGLENLSAIPGTVGAAPVQNIGAYGVEIGNFIESVEFVDLLSLRKGCFNREQCDFGYRSSYFKKNPQQKLFITSVNMRFSKGFNPCLTYKGLQDEDLLTYADIRNRVIALRRKKLPDPKVVGNAGSFFKNPIVEQAVLDKLKNEYADLPVYAAEDGKFKLAAGWLIDKSNCRGITHGNAGTWEHQALVLVNRGEARPHEIVALAKYIQAEVKTKFDIFLEPEVRVFGKDGELKWSQL